MRGGELIREARKRSGLSQRELAELLGTTQAVITRWETGRRSPSFEKVVQAVRACGLDLAVRIVHRDDEHSLLIEEALTLNPGQRLDRVAQSTAAVRDLVSAVRKRQK
jgi:transcriptional regulator with XRE-family HTH domain